MKKTFYSNGKLLLTAEYLVLDGATALALPTKFGQNLIVEQIESNKTIVWKSYDIDHSIWFEDIILFSSILISEYYILFINLLSWSFTHMILSIIIYIIFNFNLFYLFYTFIIELSS